MVVYSASAAAATGGCLQWGLDMDDAATAAGGCLRWGFGIAAADDADAGAAAAHDGTRWPYAEEKPGAQANTRRRNRN